MQKFRFGGDILNIYLYALEEKGLYFLFISFFMLHMKKSNRDNFLRIILTVADIFRFRFSLKQILKIEHKE